MDSAAETASWDPKSRNPDGSTVLKNQGVGIAVNGAEVLAH
jgi:hypothetical protein